LAARNVLLTKEGEPKLSVSLASSVATIWFYLWDTYS
jgi:hypothetical protein